MSLLQQTNDIQNTIGSINLLYIYIYKQFINNNIDMISYSLTRGCIFCLKLNRGYRVYKFY